jgi:RNA polymerase sigma-70 factor (ECF subfamily)
MRPDTEAVATQDLGRAADGLSVAEPSGVSVEINQPAPEIPELVARAKEGDRQAFAQLYRTYLPTVYKFLYYRTNSNKAMAEDMTAEVFLRALRKIGDFNWTGADFGSWLLRIARNLILDNAKSSRARLETVTDEMPEDAAGEARATEDSVMETLQNEGVYKAIKQLSPDQRDVITMRFIQGMDVSEVAAAMDKKEGTIRTLQFRGLKTLQKLLLKSGSIDLIEQKIRPGGVRLAQNGRGEGRTESEAARFGVSDGDR